MKTERRFWKRRRHWVLAAGALLAGCGALLSCQEYDLDERTPDGWGSSIYSWLDEQGNYTNTVRMIDELGYREVLAKTGSKTLFVADDEAYERFFRNNSWGVHSYSELSLSQKKLLIYGSMIDNSIQLGNLSNVEGTPPVEGECMRRFAASSIYDSVPVLKPEQMPDNPYWRQYREAGKSIVCMEDQTVVPVVQFIEKQLTNKRITNEDYNFIFNHTTERQVGEASVNGVQVSEPNIKCSNGFIHKMKDVVTPLPNMAELIASKPQLSQFNHLMERYCAPYPDLDREVTARYNYLYNTNVDTVYQKRFFSKKSQRGEELRERPDRRAALALLKYDPEWNAYFSASRKENASSNIEEQRDMGVIMVPSDQAMTDYWENGAGRVLKDYYGTWDKVPDDVVVELINNNMLASFTSSVPSKFSSILNDANDPMGVEESAIDSVWLGCNGAVYMTNRVYSPTAYVSVSFPALINQTMKVLDWAIKENQYNVYLNSLNSYYSFFIPTNNALLEYIDPVSYGKNQTQLFRFYYDESKPQAQRVWASTWNYDLEAGELGDSIGRVTDYYAIKNRLRDILDTHIVIGNVEDGKTYYRTKGGTEIRVSNVGAGFNGMTVEGSYQVNEGNPIPVSFIYDQSNGGNGKSYILQDQPIMGTRHTVLDVLKSREEFGRFAELLEGSGLLETTRDNQALGGFNVSLFNTYHYTVYVPTNESIEALQNAGKLPTLEQIAQWEESGNLEAKTRDSLKVANFVKYHIQDNALFIGAAEESGDYETGIVNPATGRFYRLKAELTSDGIAVRDEVDVAEGTTHHVLTSDPTLYNLQAREYQYNSPNVMTANQLVTSSSAVIHLIDRPLLIEK
ncbi:MAG: fasciclin domain-containing protein [Prevotella sp.]|nr:fasciclin domain-containing protein [Prevotella sp.]